MSKIKTATEQHVEWLEKKYWTLRNDGHFGIALHMLDAIEHAKEMSKLEKKTIYEAVRDAVDGCDEYYKKERNEQD